MKLRNWREVIDIDLPEVKITEETRQEVLHAPYEIRGDVRLVTGRFYTEAEFEAYRQKVLLSTPLP